MNNRKLLLIYHEEYNDCVFSAALFVNYLLNTGWNKEDIVLFPATYEKLDMYNLEGIEEQYTDIIMTDISFNDSSKMQYLYDIFNTRITWCDHHAPIIDESKRHTFCQMEGQRSTDRSAIMQVYKFLYDPFDIHYNSNDIPQLLQYLSIYDSWTYKEHHMDLDYLITINKYITLKFNLDIWKIIKFVNLLLTSKQVNYDELVEAEKYGQVLFEYDEYRYANMIKKFGDNSWIVDDNRKGCMLFIQEPTNSKIFKTCNIDIKNGIVFKKLPNDKYILSIYNTSENDNFHCGKYLKEKYGGGGHKGAAGCTIRKEQFYYMLKYKKI